MQMKSLTILSLIVLAAACSKSPTRPSMASGIGGATSDGTPGGGAARTPIDNKTAIFLADQATVPSLSRLSHLQWENAVRDLLMLDAVPGLSSKFSNDPLTMFGNTGTLFNVSDNQWAQYRDAAETMADKIGKDAAAVKKITGGSTDAKAIVSAFLRNAYRRKATDAEITLMVDLFNKGPTLNSITDKTNSGVAIMIASALQSPYFLYRNDLGDKVAGNYTQLTPFETASKLSFAIWNSIPDATLLDLAEKGELQKPAVLKAQVTRMLSDAKAKQLLSTIHVQTFKVSDFTVVGQDAKSFPEAKFDSATVQNEAKLFIEDVVVTQGKGIAELLTAPYAFVSSKTADAYGVQVSSTTPVKTQLDPQERAGLLSQVAFLSHYAKANGTTNIVKRAFYITEGLMCTNFGTPPPPPEEDPNAVKAFKTNREYTENLTTKGACAGCHLNRLNPPGFAFENFGPTGKWQTVEKSGNPVNASAEFTAVSGSISFDGPVQFLAEAVKHPEVHQCYVSKLVEALYGRPADVGDSPLIEALGAESLKGVSPVDLITKILSDPMLSSRAN